MYRLELLPTEEGRQFYSSVLNRSDENAGVDLYVVKEYMLENMNFNTRAQLLDLGTSARMVRMNADGSEQDVHYWLCPRSSIIKSGFAMANSQGVIDKSYRGTLMAPIAISNQSLFAKTMLAENHMKGDRYFQIVAPDMGHIASVVVVNSLSQTERGAGGFGSTGR
jgi:dUTP pyrophosphatase